MTTWWKDDPHGHFHQVAYSVRPDLWPAGTHCWSRRSALALLADWAVFPDECQPDEANGVPGAAEALILADQVVFGGCRARRDRLEIPDPRKRDLPHPGTP